MDILGWHGLGASEMALPVDISIVVEGMWWHTGAMSAIVPWWQLLGGGSGGRLEMLEGSPKAAVTRPGHVHRLTVPLGVSSKKFS